MPLRWLVGELRTGRITTTLPLVGAQWSMTLDQAGALSGTLTLGDDDVRALQPRVSAEPGRMFLAAAWADDTGEETILEAGPIWTHHYSASDRTLRIGAAGLWSYYDHRMLLPVLARVGGAPSVTSTFGPTSLGTIAKRMVALAHTHTAGNLPVVLPDDITGGETRTYPGSALTWVGAALAELGQEDDGPEIQFIPRLTLDGRSIEWEMRTGTPDQPLIVQAGGDVVWDASAAAGDVADIDVDIDGTRLASRAWAAGASSGETRIVEYRDDTTLTDAGWPLLEIEAEGTDTFTSARQVASVARQAVTAARYPVQAWTVRVRPGSHPTPGQLRPGHWTRVFVGQHDYLTAGEYRGRITHISGDDSEAMVLQFQPEPGVAPSPVAVLVETPAPEAPTVPPPDPETPGGPADLVTWSSGVFLNHDADAVADFGAFRGRTVAAVAVFPSHDTQSELANTWYLGSSYIPAGWTGDVAVAMPMCSDGEDVSQDISAQIQSVAEDFAAYGSNRWFIRLGWEMNLPQWDWAVNDSNLSLWRSRWSQYRAIFKDVLGDKAVMVFNPNIGPPQSGLTGSITRAWVDGEVDAAGPDAYDCWPPFTSPANIATQLGRDQGLNWWADLCHEKGAQLCLPEWGVSSGTQWAGNCGNDNPDYIQAMFDWMRGNADIMVMDAYFNEPAAYVVSDVFNPAGGASNNPLAAAKYADLFGVS